MRFPDFMKMVNSFRLLANSVFIYNQSLRTLIVGRNQSFRFISHMNRFSIQYTMYTIKYAYFQIISFIVLSDSSASSAHVNK